MSNIYDMKAHEIRDALRAKKLSAMEVLQGFSRRIDDVEGQVQSYITRTDDIAKQAALEVDKRIAAGETLSDLAGVPVGIKDNMLLEGVPATCASRMLENFIAPYSAHVIEALQAENGTIIGKLNMDEFAMGSSTETSYFKKTTNPYDETRIPGGSSGGSAAAVSAREAAYSLGSDTGGSIRQPAALCGVIGMKPTYGLVSRFGCVPLASSLDQIGPVTRDVLDCALVLNAISGHDKRDATSLNIPKKDYTQNLGNGVQGLRIGVPKEHMSQPMHDDIRTKVQDTLREYEKLGAKVVEVSLPSQDIALAAYFLITCCEASSNLARFDGISYGYRSESADNLSDLISNTRREGFGAEVKRRIMMGTFALSAGYFDAYYGRALAAREHIKADYASVFEQVDIICAPCTPETAYKIGEKINDPIKMYTGDLFMASVNIAGLPAMSLPVGMDSIGLPIGAQLIGPRLSEETLLRAAFALEQAGVTDIPAPQIKTQGGQNQ